MERRSFLRSTSLLGAVGATAGAGPAQAQASIPSQVSIGSFALVLDPVSGGVLSLAHGSDAARMSWTNGPDNAPWQPRSLLWGLGYADLGRDVMHRGRWERATSFAVDIGTREARSTYRVGALDVVVTRTFQGDSLVERYRFTNTGKDTLPMAGRKSGMAIVLPFNDNYTNSADVMEHRCHAHLWMGGSASWVALLRMGGRAPHLGLVLNEGALTGYSVTGRDEVTGSNTRGTFLVHPDITDLKPGESRELAWTLFWHRGWDDFFDQCARRSQAFVRVEASRYTAYVGETVRVSVRGARADGATLALKDATLPLARVDGAWQASIKADSAGERLLDLRLADGGRTSLVMNVVPPLDDLLAARVRFIATRQQAQDGAFVVYDNETDVQVRHERVPQASDRNDGRERVAMGVLLARWLRTQADKPADLMASLRRYVDFVAASLQRPDGFVLDGTGRQNARLYNWPWVAQLHLEYAQLTGSETSWQAFVRTIESFYDRGGDKFYAIGLPVFDGLNALKRNGRMADHARVLALFERHGRSIAETGPRYPLSEVNYEQSIVAPAAVFLLELHRATGNKAWLDAAKPHLALLELFNGRQPDHHLHEVAIRHWDGYWFGKRQLWGDTFPHYWSTLTAVAFHHYAKAGGGAAYAERADQVIRNNLSLFTADGRGSAAYIYPVTVNGQKARLYDPYANDQDWALVHALQLREA